MGSASEGSDAQLTLRIGSVREREVVPGLVTLTMQQGTLDRMFLGLLMASQGSDARFDARQSVRNRA